MRKFIKIALLMIFNLYQTSLFPKDSNKINFNCKKTYNVAYVNYGIIYNADKDSGIDKDLFMEISKLTNCKFNYEVLPRERIWNELKNGLIDITASTIPYPERKEFINFATYFFNKNYVIVRKDAKVKNMKEFNDNKDLILGERIGVKYGSKKLDNFADTLRKSQRAQNSYNENSLIQKMKYNRIQALFMNEILIKSNMSVWDEEFKKLIEVQDWIPKERGFVVSIAFSKRNINEDEFNRWKDVVNIIIKNGTIKKIYLKYFKKISPLNEETLSKLTADTVNLDNL